MSRGSVESPVRMTARLIRGGWNTFLTIYYANSLSWRLLKAGALVFLGFFTWVGTNLLLSVRPGWTVLRYPMAYGFLLIPYGPFHHLVVIPVYQRLRRRGTHLSLGGHRHLPNASLALFLALVVVLGTVPVGAMTIDLQSSLEGAGADIDPDLICVKHVGEDTTEVHCHLSESTGVDRVVVRSGDRTLVTDHEPPFEFTIREAEMATVVGNKQFRVELRDEDGDLIRRYTRSLSMIPED